MAFAKTFLLGVGFSEVQKDTILEYIVNSVEKKEKKYYVVTPNPEILVIAHKNPEYKKVLNDAKLASIDGIGVVWALRFLGKHAQERLSGVDIVKNLCERVAEKPITVGFLGGKGGVAEKTAECLIRSHPKLNVSFVSEEWDESGFCTSKKHIDILFVAFGSPKQEEWIARNISSLPIMVAIGVGGAFDFISGRVHRAPVLVQRIGLEWLFRLILQPWRIKRQLRLIEFVFLVLGEKFKKSSAQ